MKLFYRNQLGGIGPGHSMFGGRWSRADGIHSPKTITSDIPVTMEYEGIFFEDINTANHDLIYPYFLGNKLYFYVSTIDVPPSQIRNITTSFYFQEGVINADYTNLIYQPDGPYDSTLINLISQGKIDKGYIFLLNYDISIEIPLINPFKIRKVNHEFLNKTLYISEGNISYNSYIVGNYTFIYLPGIIDLTINRVKFNKEYKTIMFYNDFTGDPYIFIIIDGIIELPSTISYHT